jgi:hypothetical protein
VQFWRAAMDHFEESQGEEYALRADLAYNFDDESFIRRIKGGVRYADRDQEVRYTTYNWGALSEVWSGSAVSLAKVGGDQTEFFDFHDFFRGKTAGPPGGYYLHGDLIKDYDQAASCSTRSTTSGIARNGGGGAGAANRWVRAEDRAAWRHSRITCRARSSGLDQKDVNAYLMMNFGTPEAPTACASRATSACGTSDRPGLQRCHDRAEPDDARHHAAVQRPVRAGRPPAGAPPGSPTPGGVCRLTGAVRQPADLGGEHLDGRAAHRRELVRLLPAEPQREARGERRPAVPLRGLTGADAPDSSYVRNYRTIGIDGNGQLNANAGNPYLHAGDSWQFDLTAEWYFAQVGSLTFNVFYKDVKNFFYQQVDQTSGDQQRCTTRHARCAGPRTSTVTARSRASRSPTSRLTTSCRASSAGSASTPTTRTSTARAAEHVPQHRQPGQHGDDPAGQPAARRLSKHNATSRCSTRRDRSRSARAYNWRSRFLLTAADVIFPYYLDLQRGHRAARRVDLLQHHGPDQGRRPGGEHPQRGHQDLAGLHRRSGCLGTALVLHERPPLLVHRSRQFLTWTDPDRRRSLLPSDGVFL